MLSRAHCTAVQDMQSEKHGSVHVATHVVVQSLLIMLQVVSCRWLFRLTNSAPSGLQQLMPQHATCPGSWCCNQAQGAVLAMLLLRRRLLLSLLLLSTGGGCSERKPLLLCIMVLLLPPPLLAGAAARLRALSAAWVDALSAAGCCCC